MTLVQAWADSVSLLKFNNLHLFVLVTIKSIMQAYRTLFYYWWWLFLIINTSYGAPLFFRDQLVYFYAELICRWSYQCMLFAVILSTRPSIMPKNCAYFRSYMAYFLLYVPAFLVLPLSFWPARYSVDMIFTNLFFLDSPKKLFVVANNDYLLALFRSVRMIVANLPLLFCVQLFYCIPVYCITKYIFIDGMLSTLIGAFLLPISVCTYTNIYIKKLHDQFDLYYTQPK